MSYATCERDGVTLRHTWKANARRSLMDPEIWWSAMVRWFRE
ncbi:MAG: hypothetical protein ACLQT6_05495 [Desulfomonilaceae bacterium]